MCKKAIFRKPPVSTSFTGFAAMGAGVEWYPNVSGIMTQIFIYPIHDNAVKIFKYFSIMLNLFLILLVSTKHGLP